MPNAKGFTFIELLIVIGLTTVLASISIPIYGNWHISTEADAAVLRVIQDLRVAREQSTSGLNKSSHGVFFETDKFTLYEGDAYETRNSANDRITELGGGAAISVSPSIDINFSPKGIPNHQSEITIDFNGASRVIMVNGFGVVDENGQN